MLLLSAGFDLKIVFVGCVKGKRHTAMQAKDLYNSRLFDERRIWAEDAQARWFIISAKHGLLDPTHVIAPYDETLRGMSRRRQRSWAVVLVLMAIQSGRRRRRRARAFYAGIAFNSPIASL